MLRQMYIDRYKVLQQDIDAIKEADISDKERAGIYMGIIKRSNTLLKDIDSDEKSNQRAITETGLKVCKMGLELLLFISDQAKKDKEVEK